MDDAQARGDASNGGLATPAPDTAIGDVVQPLRPQMIERVKIACSACRRLSITDFFAVLPMRFIQCPEITRSAETLVRALAVCLEKKNVSAWNESRRLSRRGVRHAESITRK